MRNRFDFSRNGMLRLVGLRRRNMAGMAFASLGVLGLGMLAGAGVALLLAPRKGSELRADLRDTLRNVGQKVGDYAGKIGRRAAQVGKVVSDDVAEALDQLHEPDTGYGGNGVSTNYPPRG
jgi:YtxH-like protein